MSDIATSLISDEEREYLILKNRANTAADDGTYEWALNEIERLREALREITSADIQCWAMVALTNPDPKAWRDMLEQIAQYDMQKIAINALIERKE